MWNPNEANTDRQEEEAEAMMLYGDEATSGTTNYGILFSGDFDPEECGDSSAF